MLSIIIALGIIFLITTALIVGEMHAKDSHLMVSLRAWQAYLAALIGLSAVIVSIVVPEKFEDTKNRRIVQKLEIAYLVDLGTRLDRLERNARAHEKVIKDAIEDKGTFEHCVTVLGMLNKWKTHRFWEAPDSEALRNLTTQTYFTLSHAYDIQHQYLIST